MNDMISMFIDDEMDIDEKIRFAETIQKVPSFAAETLDLLFQEKRIRANVVEMIPQADIQMGYPLKRFFKPLLQPVALVTCALTAIIVFLFLFIPQQTPQPISNRFVIYRPDVNKVEITGTFTDWKSIPLQKIGKSGYWEISLPLEEGEHRFSYILEGRQTFADPTIPLQESDDFGGKNSVFIVGKNV